ncbi:MAG: BREX system P-loop protein BrxC [Bacteroidales bacterium]|nr:BREX system P-loop protein BrxC [Bacteroidales bacterium]
MIQDLFIKDVNREIETVVKADDIRNVDAEVREYVITKEINEKIGDLFSQYGNTKTVNGVWIHGFFGSGKSHLLKMLSYVFGNKKLECGTSVAHIFASKTTDEFIKADIHRIASIPSESILFNIDQQAIISHNENKDSVLLVFYKMFYDHLGFYGAYPHIAEFEWWLRFEKNIYTEFKEQFLVQTGMEWADARRNYYDPDVTDGLSAALANLLKREEKEYNSILEDIEKRQNLSIDHLAGLVAEYINTKPRNFHLNFFVDEVGQYIAGDETMMLNLQTIAESLATATGHKSWIFATAQSQIEGLGEDLKWTQDYARILGRFKVKISLSSANVDEVIEKRLLDKKKEHIPSLKKLYNKEKALINTIISSTDGGMPIVAYKDEEDFVLKYPFLFYQFTLFQECRTSLASHDVFQGKHASVGERNMLGVFQSVLKDISRDNVLTVPSFDKMYKGIENDLRAEFVSGINNAQTNLNDPFAIKVLKTLFLVKYYKQFLATKESIAMLLIDHVHIDIKAHQDKVNKALSKLEFHSYIERNGHLYEFLTNKEKDIEREIKNTRIEESRVNQLLKELFFDDVLGRNRIAYTDNRQEYIFTQKLDGGIFGREHELAIEIFTPNYEGREGIEVLKSQTMGLPVLRLVTQGNSEFMDDVRMYLKVHQYHALNQMVASNNETRSILYQKLSDNSKRKESLRNRANVLLGKAEAFVNGAKLDVLPRESGKIFVEECFQHLIKIIYPGLRMLGTTAYNEDTFKDIIQGHNIPLIFDSSDITVSEAETQLLNFVERRKKQHERTSVYDLKNHFAKKPFGWYDNATFTLLSKLYKKNKVEVTIGENPLDNNELTDALLNSSQHSRAFIVGQTVYTPQQVTELKELYRNLFDRNSVYNDAKDVATDFKDRLKELAANVSTLLAQSSDFPFVKTLQPFYDRLHEWSFKSYKEIVENPSQLEELLIATKENEYDPITSFINGQQAVIYKNIRSTVAQNTPNSTFVVGDEFNNLVQFLENPKPYLGNALREAEEYRKVLQEKIKTLIKTEKETTQKEYKKSLEMLHNHPELQKLTPTDLDRLILPIKQKLADLNDQEFVGNLRSGRDELSAMVVEALNTAVELNASTAPSLYGETSTQGKHRVEGAPAIKYVNRNNVHVPFPKTELTTAEDVQDYATALQETFLKEIEDNKRIRL